MTKPRIVLISTGGTIAMTTSADGGIVPALSGDDLVRAVPQLTDIADLDVHSFAMKPGTSLTLEELSQIADLIDSRLADGYAGAVVVQGTDTIEETAFVFDVLVASDKPVVVTGAMRGATAAGADGPANLVAAVTVAASSQAMHLGTVVVLNDEVHAARFVQKSHTASTAAFTSPGFGPLGRVIEGVFERYANVTRTPSLMRPDQDKVTDAAVAIIKVPLGDDGRLLQVLPELGYRGAVIEAMGAGHLPAHFADKLSDLVKHMPVVLATRVPAGRIFKATYGFTGSEIDLLARGLIHGGNISSVKACLLLRLLLAQGLDDAALRAAYARRC
jgi:L-asparaginase